MTAPSASCSWEANARADRWSGVPSGWRRVSAEEEEQARSRTLDDIQAASTLEGLQRVERALAPASTHPIRLLALWPSIGPFSSGDLLVIQLLGHAVSLETCLAIAGDDGAHVRTIARYLRALPIDRAACMADADTLIAMDDLWSALFEALRSGGAAPADAETAAHRLCARKAPMLFPASNQTFDDVTGAEDSRHRAWQLHRYLDGDAEVRGAVANLVCAAQDYDLSLGHRLSGMWTLPIIDLCTTVDLPATGNARGHRVRQLG